jgi:hypothetical protein
VAQPSEQTKTSILPEPELNPLLNPLLAAHMGRWAEVYFTSPPEKRAQAVSDLVRELASQSAAEPASSERNSPQVDGKNDRRAGSETGPEASEVRSYSSSNPVQQRTLIDDSRFPKAGTSESSLSESALPEQTIAEPTIAESGICESCGHHNTTQQRFCGMCGMPLALLPENPSQPLPETERPVKAAWDASDAPASGVAVEEWNSDPESRPADEYTEPLDHRPWQQTEEMPAEFSVLSDYQSEPAPRGYRVYIGAMVAILLGLLVYMTWRSNTAFWSSGSAPSALPESPKSETAAEPPATPPAQPGPKANAPTEPARTASTLPTGKPAEALPQRTRADREIKPRPVARTEKHDPSANMADSNGSEELATAEKYLNAGPGTARDSRQASMWLWKAVAKKNSTATLLLSDLYLRGDGVTKSCDQARLLLDAAARKGATAAAQRLRNLEAFGCR